MRKCNRTVLFSISAYLMHWVNSILTYCEISITGKGVLYPRILFVATHKDQVVRYTIKYGEGGYFSFKLK